MNELNIEITNKTINDIYPGRWLKPTMIRGNEITLTISDIHIEIRDNVQKIVLEFREIPAKLMLNYTNGRAISEIHGEALEGWIGKLITIFKIKIPYEAGEVTALRIKQPESRTHGGM